MTSLLRLLGSALAAAGMGLLFAASSAAAECNPDTALFSDDFEDFLDATWGDPDEGMKVVDGVLVVKSYRGQVNFATTGKGRQRLHGRDHRRRARSGVYVRRIHLLVDRLGQLLLHELLAERLGEHFAGGQGQGDRSSSTPTRPISKRAWDRPTALSSTSRARPRPSW